MKYNVIGRGITLKDSIKEQIEKKLGRLDRFFSADTSANVILTPLKDQMTVEVTIPIKGSIIRAEGISSDIGTALEEIGDILETQIKRHKKKLIDKHHQKEAFSELFIAEEENAEDEKEIIIEKTKRFAYKPMDPEEACLQMDLLGHNFFVFNNAQTDDVCVVYKRKNGTYGLIEPEE